MHYLIAFKKIKNVKYLFIYLTNIMTNYCFIHKYYCFWRATPHYISQTEQTLPFHKKFYTI